MAKPETLAALKVKFPKLTLDKKKLDAIADKIEAKVTDDNTLDAAIDTFNEYNPLDEIQKADDRLRKAQADLKAAKNPNTPKDDDKKDDEPIVTDDMPAWAKVLVDQNKKLGDSLAQMQAEKAKGGIRQSATEKLKDIPVSYWGKRALPEKEEDLEAFVTEVQTDYTAFEKEMTDSGIKIMPRPASGGAAPTTGSKTVSQDLKNHFQPKTPQTGTAPGQAPSDGKTRYINTPQPL